MDPEHPWVGRTLGDLGRVLHDKATWLAPEHLPEASP
jgi:hypothetical protein